MNLRQLKYFVRIVEMQNITRAAESLHIAQPALSQQIALLERNLGAQLLSRGPKGVQPTSEGSLLYRHAQVILRQVDTTRSIIARGGDDIAGTVSVGLASSTARILAQPLMQRVKTELPSVVLEIVDIPSADLTKLVLQGRIDFSLSPDQPPMRGIVREPVLHEDLLLLAHTDIRLPQRKLRIADFAALSFILPSLPNSLRTRLEYAFMLAGFKCELYAEASTSAILIPTVRLGAAATILPYSSAHPEITDGTIRPYLMQPNLSRELILCANDSLPLTAAITRVMDLCKDEIKRLVREDIWRYAKVLY